jgi:hypothetical protein
VDADADRAGDEQKNAVGACVGLLLISVHPGRLCVGGRRRLTST